MGIIRENEIYINDDRLCFLFSLLINKKAVFSDIHKSNIESFKNTFNTFIYEIAETYIQTLPDEKKEQIRELAEDDIDLIPIDCQDWYNTEYQEDEETIIITLKENGEPLRNILKRYAQKHWNDDLVTWNSTNHYCSEKICRDFYNEILDYNCKDYHTDKLENIQAIVLGYFKGYISIESINCNIDLISIADMLFIPFYPYQDNIIDSFECCINAQEFKKGFNQMLNDVQLSTDKEIIKFGPKEQMLYDYLVDWINKLNSHNIDSYDIANHLGYNSYTKKDKDALNSLVSSVNKKYRVLNKIKDTKVRLLKKNRRSGYYEILKEFKPNK